MQVVPGILGAPPLSVTHGGRGSGGEDKGESNLESVHSLDSTYSPDRNKEDPPDTFNPKSRVILIICCCSPI